VFAITTNRWHRDVRREELTTGVTTYEFQGIRLLQAPIEGDAVLLAEIDPRMRTTNARRRNHLLNDRRPEMYA
jgi:hypothetical protein